MKITNKIVIDTAHESGFSLVGFCKAEELSEESTRFEKWLKRGYQAGMAYMEKNTDRRRNIDLILPGAKSVISLGMNYYTNNYHENKDGYGKISRYAWGKDYHYIIWDALDEMITKFRSIDNSFEGKSYVDTGPVMDKAWAVRAGLGWLGKHTNVISTQIGSWFFIANIITNYNFKYDKQKIDHCGTCRACIDACPTNAIADEYLVDANKCISYLTIENKGAIPAEFEGKFDRWVFGCDICQEVCPWNIKFAVESKVEEYNPVEGTEINLDEIESMTQNTFKQKFGTTPITRARLKGIKRNANFLRGRGY